MSPSPSIESRVTRLETNQEHFSKDLDQQETLIGQFGQAANTMERVTETLSTVVTQLDTVSKRLTTVEEKLRDETLIRTYRNNHIRNLASGVVILVMLWSDKLGDAITQSTELIPRWFR